MIKELISKKTRNEFREFLSKNSVLGRIEIVFEAGDVNICKNFTTQLQGERRKLVERYYASIDFNKWNDVSKILNVYEFIIKEHKRFIPDEVEKLIKCLEKDGFKFINEELKPISITSGINQTKSIAFKLDLSYMAQEIERIENSINSDPSLAIGEAKSLLETCCKTILNELGKVDIDSYDFNDLIKETRKKLNLLPENIPNQIKGEKAIKNILHNLGSISHQLAELRNLYGSGHGKHGKTKGLQPRHANLAVGCAVTLSTFFLETYLYQKNKSN